MFVYQLANARRALDKVSNYQGVEFAYAVFKNKQFIDNKLMEVDFIKNVSPEVIEYEQKRLKFCEDFADKDDEGKAIIENDLYKITNKDEFQKKMDELLEQYKTPVEERQKQIEIFNEKMNMPSDLEFIKIKKEQLPQDIVARDLEEIFFMVE
jgi:hypothetical protein